MIVVVVFFSLEVFHFPAIIPFHQHSTLVSEACEGSALSSTLTNFSFLLVSLILPRPQLFWVSVFYPQVFFNLHSFPTFSQFCDSDAGSNTHLGSSSLPTLTELPILDIAWLWTTSVLITRPLFKWLR